MKKILINLLAISSVAVTFVACSSGSSGSSAPAAPAATQINPPVGFAPPADLSSGVAVNAASGQVAVPTSNGYQTLQLTGAAAAALAANPDTAEFVSSGSTLLMTIPAAPGGSTTVYMISEIATQAAKTLTAISTTTESYSYTATPTSNLFAATLQSKQALVFGAGSYIDIIFPNGSGVEPQTVNVVGTVTAVDGSMVNNIAYLAAGTSAGKVWVLNGADLTPTDLSAQAPASKYTPGNVNSFGLPSSLQTTTSLVGYWNVGTIGTSVNIYRVTGYYKDGQPTGNGFLNTTLAGQQTTTNGTTIVTFTGFPANNAIYSSYVDSVGNVWAGTNNGQVYVLRAGATQWTQAKLASGKVTVGYNGSASGATAVVFNGSQTSVTYSVQ